jgi:hypothetical protein
VKGVIFNLLEEVVVTAHGDRVWDDLLDAAGLDGVYTSLGSYDDAEMQRLVSVAATALSISDDEVLRWFGQQAIPNMVQRWPDYFSAHERTLPFLRSLNSVIHPEVRKLYSGAYCPHFDFTSHQDGSLLIGYRSPRRLCGLAHGFILGAADHYGEKLTVRHLECMQEGDNRCLVAVSATDGGGDG